MGIEFTKGVVDTNTVAKEIKMDDFLKGLKGNDKAEMESIFSHYAGKDGVLSSDELTKAMEEVQEYAARDGKKNEMSGKEARANAAKIAMHIEGKDITTFWSRIGEIVKNQKPEDVLTNTYDKDGKLVSQKETDKDKNVIVTAYANGVASKKTTTSADGKIVTVEEGDKKTVTDIGTGSEVTSEYEKGSPIKTTTVSPEGTVIVEQYGAGGLEDVAIRTTTIGKNETEETFDSDGSLQKKVVKEGDKAVITDYVGAKGAEKPTLETTVDGKTTTVKTYDKEGGYTQAVTEEGKAAVTTKHDKDGKLIDDKPAVKESKERTLAEVQKEINQKLKDSKGEWNSELNTLVAERTSLRKKAGISEAPAVKTSVVPEKAPGRATNHKDFVYDEAKKQTYKKGADGKYEKFDAEYVASTGGYRKGKQHFTADGTEIKEGSAKANKAKMEGWRTTDCKDVFYDKKTKLHYKYDEKTSTFKGLNKDTIQVTAFGSYITKDANGVKHYFDANDREMPEAPFELQANIIKNNTKRQFLL